MISNPISSRNGVRPANAVFRERLSVGKKVAESVLSTRNTVAKATVSEQVKRLLKDAESGIPKAQFELGIKFFRGEPEVGISKNIDRAAELLLAAASTEIANVQNVLADIGYCYCNAKGVSKDLNKGRKCLEVASSKGHARATYNLAILYLNGLGVEADYQKALNLFETAAASKYHDATFAIGLFYLNGWVVEQDFSEAHEYFEIAANHGHVNAKYYLGSLFERGLGREKDCQKALKLYEEAANQGASNALFAIGLFYEKGCVVSKDFDEARKYFEVAASKGHAGAKYKLALIYQCGLGVEQDYQKAFRLFEKAADEGDIEAIFSTGLCYCNGLGVAKDYDKARSHFQAAAIKGHAGAKHNLAFLYETDLGGPYDQRIAQRLFAEAAQAGFQPAIQKMKTIFQLDKKITAPSQRVEKMKVPARCDVTSDTSSVPEQVQHKSTVIVKLEQSVNVQPNLEASEYQTLLLKQQQQLFDKCRNLEAAIEHSQKKLEEITKNGTANSSVDLSALQGKEETLISALDREALHLQTLKEIQKIKENEKGADYYFVFQNTFNKVIAACMIIDTKMLGGAQETLATEKLDKIRDVTKTVEACAQVIPGIGYGVKLILKLFNGPLNGYTNLQRARAIKHAATLFTGALSYETIGEMVARQLTLSQISAIEAINTTKPGFFKRQLERYHRLQDHLLQNEDVDTNLRLFAEEQCQILLMAFMKKEVLSRPEPKDVPFLVGLVIKTDTASVVTAAPPSLSLEPVRNSVISSSDKALIAQIQNLQEARKKDQERLRRVENELQEANRHKITWEEFQKYEKAFKAFMRITFPEASAGSNGPMDQLVISQPGFGEAGMNAWIIKELVERSEREKMVATRLLVLEQKAGIDPFLERKENDSSDKRRELLST